MKTAPSGLLGKVEFTVLLAAIIVTAGLWGFVELMEVARDSAPHGFDTEILLALRRPGDLATPIGPHWLQDAMRDLTSLGGVAVLTLITIVVIGYLLVVRQARTALFVFVAIAGGQVLGSLLKLGIDRPRPDIVPHLVQVQTLSFPSGHAMMSAVIYLTLGALLAQTLHDRATRIYVLAVAVLATLIVGLSRLYLGVHWPSDVAAGWCIGAAWAMLCWLVARWLRRRAAISDRAAHPEHSQ
ncbi:undecaprenyl-diphosphatase [Pseudaminobacter salicylatoxidans]|uniref:Undecaprenyl-diphosphatase n=1 Tax=Pseudaminobacter salicylatoxidans TaxID=93369 RepID=A0A316BXC0_PSESE|nr:phosphatase PAP2 family protein [Pseudaminobacter salicylatoxidans]PWJ78432.1 undecaprenyl-diphosphatase [Pseudaminobacter salicylatoxidans]